MRSVMVCTAYRISLDFARVKMRCSACGGEDKSIQILARKHGRKKPLERTRRSWEDSIKRDVREIGWSGAD
jgi:hypothetical protein